MQINLAIAIGLLYAAGVYLMLRRNVVKLIFGPFLLGHAANLLIFTVGGLVRAKPPLAAVGADAPPPEVADPLPQALVLTAIVIGFGMTAYAIVLALKANGEFESDRVDAGGEG